MRWLDGCLHVGVAGSSRGLPLVTPANGTLMARCRWRRFAMVAAKLIALVRLLAGTAGAAVNAGQHGATAVERACKARGPAWDRDRSKSWRLPATFVSSHLPITSSCWNRL